MGHTLIHSKQPCVSIPPYTNPNILNNFIRLPDLPHFYMGFCFALLNSSVKHKDFGRALS